MIKSLISVSYSVAGAAFGLALALLAGACSSDAEPAPNPEESIENVKEGSAYMTINVSPYDSKSTDASIPTWELMHSLRIVVLDADGKIEHNKYFPDELFKEFNGVEGFSYRFKVKTSGLHQKEKKTVYLFANEESISTPVGSAASYTSLTDFFTSYNVGKEDFASSVENIEYTPTYTSDGSYINLPMSAKYVVEVENTDVSADMYLVRIPTKFSVKITNNSGKAAELQNVTIRSLADKTYLIPHVAEGSQTMDDKYWIDWLKGQADNLSAAGYEASLGIPGITSYSIPADAKHNPTIILSESISLPASAEPFTTSFYAAESSYKAYAESHNPQSYMISMKVNDAELEAELPNLPSLFRNTHAIIDVILTITGELKIIVEVTPYNQVTLKPDFGIEPEGGDLGNSMND